MKTNKSQGYTSTGSINPTANQVAPGKKMRGADGYLIVNYHSMFFKMTHLGNYIPWPPTVDHGKLMPSQEWARLKEVLGNVETLTEFQNKRAAKIAMELKKDPFYTLRQEQRVQAIINKENYVNAKNEGITVKEYLHRKTIREQKLRKKAQKSSFETTEAAVPVSTKTQHGQTVFSLASVPSFQRLQTVFAHQ